MTYIKIMRLLYYFFLLLLSAGTQDVPEQIHVAIGEIPTKLIISWSTRKPNDSILKVKYHDGWKSFTGSYRNFTDGSNSWCIHSVPVYLLCGKEYEYVVGSEKSGFSEQIKIKGPPNQEPTKTLFIGDLSFHLGGKDTWHAVKSFVSSNSVHTIVMLGDLAYNLHSKSSTRGDSYMNSLQPVVQTVPLMVTPGNHESFDKYQNFLSRFQMPNNKFFYTFTAGFVRFVSINTEFFFNNRENLDEMVNYVKDELDRTWTDVVKYPWLVVYGHRPMYCESDFKAQACLGQSGVIRQRLEILFSRYRVDLYVNAHVHNYQRTLPVFEGKSSEVNGNRFEWPWKTVYITNGAAGAEGENTKVGKRKKGGVFFVQEDEHSFGIMSVANKTHLRWEQVYSKNQEVFDEFWIVKD